VIVACAGEQALRESQLHGDTIELVLLDVVTPKINGPKAYARMNAEGPDVAVILASGYSPDIALLHRAQAQGLTVLQNPHVPRELARRIRETLGRQPAKVPQG
jgi:two-component system, cell cycle sensor histidine kinase and response regulator CckA